MARSAQAVFSIGRLASRQAARPPASACAFSKPSFFSVATARAARAPVGHTTTSGSVLFFGSSLEASRLAQRHVLRAGGVAGGEFGGLADVDQHRLLAVDQLHGLAGVTRPAPPPPLSTIGQSSRPPEVRAARNRTQLSMKNFTGAVQALRRKARIIEFSASAAGPGPACPHTEPGQTMHKLVLIRHGESTWNLENRFTGWTDVDLTPTGVAQAREAGPAAEGRRLRVRRGLHLGAQARHLDAVARAGRDGPHLAAGGQRLAPERAPLRRAAGPEQGRDGEEVRRRAGAGLAPQLRHAAARAGRRATRAASAATRATPSCAAARCR